MEEAPRDSICPRRDWSHKYVLCGNMMEPESSKGEPGIAVGTRFAQILRSRTTISVPLKVHHGRGHGERTYEEMIHVQELFTRSSSSEWTP
jgi:hypothetical protein